MASLSKQLHFLLIPLMSQSHIIPLTDFAKLLALHGVTVSIITTPLNAQRYKSIVTHAMKSNLKIQLIPLHFPNQEVGLPQECENLDTLSSLELFNEFFLASEMMQEPLEKLIQDLEPKPSCIISTSPLIWTQQVANKFKIPRYVFQTVSCFTLFCSHIINQEKIQETLVLDSDSFLIPNVPHKIEFTKGQMLIGTSTNKSQDMKSIIDKIKQSQDLARGTLINTFEELEPWYIDEYKKIMNKVFCIGPVSLCNKEMVDRGNKICIDEHSCLSWLDSMKPKSVIYACFGSLCQISSLQMKEIGLGLESSNVPFIWVIRKLNLTLEVEKWLRDENFEEKVKGRGMIIRGWAPQVLILSHLSIGGFLTHCGWNSTLEGISCGVPMITFPMFAEQFYNEKFIVNVLKIGVRVGVEVSINSWNEEKNGVLVNKDQVKKAIDQLMDKGLEGEERRKRTKELAHMSKMVIKEEGSSFLNTKLLIEDVMQLLKNKEGEANNVARTM
ncbi:UDP-glycosyltransferase 73C4-like [Nicotiana tomentosiformis]|uniref:UDP-glycosyltransferase 73C4-like n=1 Tax=Nicotiana tomentosiformis TaxID=4098 RepID=UPI00051C08F7|nr:UDP-glycosyltransferase 73C4-like [Nicotiana tomentosiformis]